MIERLKRAWALPSPVDIDAPEAISHHAAILDRNPILWSLYRDRYRQIVEELADRARPDLAVVEVGAGPSRLERYLPGVIKSDVVAHPNIDRVMEAGALDCADGSLGALVGVNVLHHLAEPARFLREADRCLADGGRLVLIEPSNSPLQKLSVRFSPHETSDDSVTEWTNVVRGRLSGANNALPWIIFVRDRARFEREFPRLVVRRLFYHGFVRHYLSGGFSYRPLLPGWCHPLVAAFDRLAQPFARRLGFEMTIVIDKVPARP